MRRSAGILLYRSAEPGIEVLLVHPGGPYWTNKDAGAWSIPKGEYDDDEDPRACALRELAEELGASAPAVAPEELIDLGEATQKSSKVVRGWAVAGEFDPEQLDSMTFEIEWPPRSGQTRSFPEVDRAGWFDPDEARSKLNPAQTVFVDRLLAHLRQAERT